MELDPNGKNAHEIGAKLDKGKAPVMRGVMHYFPRAVEAVARLSDIGARKYAWKGWTEVQNGSERYGDALCRHILAEEKDGPIDRDTGELHAVCAAWNALARLELLLTDNESPRDSAPPLPEVRFLRANTDVAG